jgi:hypothetical protein
MQRHGPKRIPHKGRQPCPHRRAIEVAYHNLELTIDRLTVYSADSEVLSDRPMRPIVRIPDLACNRSSIFFYDLGIIVLLIVSIRWLKPKVCFRLRCCHSEIFPERQLRVGFLPFAAFWAHSLHCTTMLQCDRQESATLRHSA